MDCTISLLCYNRLDFTRKCIQSILDAKTKLSYEIIVTDNASTDTTAEFLFKMRVLSSPMITVITHKENLGFIGGHEYLIANNLIKGDYLILLNNDTEVGDWWLDKIVEEFKKDPLVRVVGAEAGLIDETGLGKTASKTELNYDYIEGSCFAVDVSKLPEIGGLFSKELLFSHAEDAELSFRVKKLGFKIKRVDISFLHKKSNPTFDLLDKKKVDIHGYWVRNFEVLKKRHGFYLKHKHFNEHICIQREGAIGDALLVSPIIESLKLENPSCKITLSTNAPHIVTFNKYIDQIFPHNIIPKGVDRVINLDMAYEKRPLMHVIDAYAEVAGVKLATRMLRIDLPKDIPNKFNYLKNYIIVHIGPTAWPGRNLPASTMDEVVMVLKDKGYYIVEIGHQVNLKKADLTMNGISVEETIMLIKNCEMFLGIDSAPMHIAQAFDKPGVVAFGCILPEYRIINKNKLKAIQAKNIVCLGCHHWQYEQPRTFSDCLRLFDRGACMRDITADQILEEVECLT